MLKEALARVRNLFKSSEYWKKIESEAYERGLEEGKDFGKIVAHNYTLASELPDILNRYSRLQLRIINKPASYIKAELSKFQETEIDRLQMDLQR